jgi:hypothetical protein
MTKRGRSWHPKHADVLGDAKSKAKDSVPRGLSLLLSGFLKWGA